MKKIRKKRYYKNLMNKVGKEDVLFSSVDEIVGSIFGDYGDAVDIILEFLENASRYCKTNPPTEEEKKNMPKITVPGLPTYHRIDKDDK